MRTTLVSVLVVLAQWGMLATAQPQTGAVPSTWPGATSGYFTHPPTKRFFFMYDPTTIGRPVVFGQPSQAPGARAFPRSYSIINPVHQNFAHPTPRFSPTGLVPLESTPPQDFWRFLRPKNSRLFFFSKP